MLTKEVIQAYASIDRWGVIYGERGFAAGQIALGAELYVPPRERSQLRLDMLDVQEDYYRRFQKHLDLMLYKSKENPDRLKKLSLDRSGNPFYLVKEAIGKPHPQDGYQNTVFGTPRHPDFPDPNKFGIFTLESTCYVNGEDDNDLSYHKASIPVSNGKGKLHFDILRDCVLAWVKRLRPVHGLAGLTILMSDDITDGPYILPTLKKYPGLDVQVARRFSSATEGIYDRIKCVNWLTVLGDEIAEDLGGLVVLKNALEPECTLYPYPGGIMIQAGEAPRLADVDVPGASELLIPYRKVAFITKRVRFMDYKSYLFRVDEPLNDEEEAKKWVSRFD